MSFGNEFHSIPPLYEKDPLIIFCFWNVVQYIENTSWKVLAYGIYARVVDVTEIERRSAEPVRFLIQKQRVRKYRTKHFPCGIVFIMNNL